MKKEIKTNKKNKISTILLVLILVLPAISSVSCDNGIFTTRNNKLAYTEVLESRGSYIYNEEKYDSLSDIIKSISAKGDTSEQTIKIDGDIISRELVITPDMNINIDLDGHGIKFIDIKGSAIKIEEGASLSIADGSLTLNDQENQDLTVITAENADSLNLSGLVINSSDKQENLDINGVRQTTLDKDVVIKGPVTIYGGKDNTQVIISNRLPDVRMNGGSLVIEGHGGAIINENNGDNSYSESPHGTIIDQTGSIEADSVADALYCIDRDPVKSFFGSLEKAIADLHDGENEIILIDDEDSSSPKTVTLNVSITLNMQGYTPSTYNFILSGDSNLTIKGTGTSEFTGNITSENGISNLTITGPEDGSKGPTMKGSIDVTGTVNANSITFTSDIEADGDINLDNCSIGDNNGNDHVYSPSIDITDSSLNNVDLEGDNVKITNPLTDSSVGNLSTDKLNITDTADNLTVGDITLSGNNNNTINGGNYGEFTFNGTGNLNIQDGNFNNEFNHSGSGNLNVSGGKFNGSFNHTGSGARSFTAGSFTVTGSNSNNNFSEIDTISSYVGQNGSVTIVYFPSDIVYLSGNYAFGSQLTSGKTVKIEFKEEFDENSQLIKGVAVNNNQTATLNFSSGVTQVKGSLYVKLGGILNSTKDIGAKQDSSGVVAKLTDSGKISASVGKTGSNPYVFKAKVDVILRAVGNEGSIKHDYGWSCDYNTNTSLPLASTLGSDFDRSTQKVDGWSTSASSSRTKTYDDGGTVKLTEDCELYAVWASKNLLSAAVAIPSGKYVGSDEPLYKNDDTWTVISSDAGITLPFTGGRQWNYYYINTTNADVYVRGVYVPGRNYKQEWMIFDYEDSYINTEDTKEEELRTFGEIGMKAYAEFSGYNKYVCRDDTLEKINGVWTWTGTGASNGPHMKYNSQGLFNEP